jgi:hypothetical protein
MSYLPRDAGCVLLSDLRSCVPISVFASRVPGRDLSTAHSSFLFLVICEISRIGASAWCEDHDASRPRVVDIDRGVFGRQAMLGVAL